MTKHSFGPQPPADWRWDLLFSGLLAVAVFSGKLGLGRLLPAITDGYWTEIRLWATLGAMAMAWRARDLLSHRRSAVPLGIALLVLCSYIAIRGAFDHGPGFRSDLTDMGFLLAQCALVCLSTRRQLLLVAAAVIALALLMFLLAAAGVGDVPLNGDGWGPIGGPTTFYRIEFLAVCLCWAFFQSHGLLRWLLPLLAAVFMFGAAASLSKAALPGAALVLTGLILHAAWRKDLQRAASIGLSAVVAIGLWQVTMADTMHARLLRAMSMSGEHEPVPRLIVNPEQRGPLHVRLPGAPAGLRIGTDFRVLTQYCVSKASPDAGSARADTHCVQRELFDRSSRLLFAAIAVTDLEADPIWGLGPDRFTMQMPNLKTGAIETYTYPHNLILEVAHAGGAVGTLLLLVALGILVRGFTRAGLEQPAIAALAGAVLFLFLSSLVSGDFYDSRLIWLIGFAVLALMPAPVTKSPQARVAA